MLPSSPPPSTLALRCIYPYQSGYRVNLTSDLPQKHRSDDEEHGGVSEQKWFILGEQLPPKVVSAYRCRSTHPAATKTTQLSQLCPSPSTPSFVRVPQQSFLAMYLVCRNPGLSPASPPSALLWFKHAGYSQGSGCRA